MYAGSNVALGSSVRQNPPWSGEEWVKIAAELKRTYPDRSYSTYAKVPFTVAEVEEAAEAVLPPERHKAIELMIEVRADLFSAFRQISSGHAPVKEVPTPRAPAQRVIKWQPEEWEAVVTELYACHPDLFDSPATFVEKFTAYHFRRAQDVLPTERHRSELKHREDTASQFLKIWLDHGDRLKAQLLERRKTKEFSSAIITGPMPSAANERSQMSAAIQKAFEAPEKAPKAPPKTAKTVSKRRPGQRGKDQAPRKVWRPAEWEALARALVTQNPKAGFLDEEPTVPSMAMIEKAQHTAIYPERRRKNVAPYLVVPNVNPIFAKMREERAEAEEAARKTAEEQVTKEPWLDEVQSDSIHAHVDMEEAFQHKSYVEEPAKEPENAFIAPVAALQKTALVMDYERKVEALTEHAKGNQEPQTFGQALVAASAPLLNVIMGKLASMMVPELTKAIVPEVTKAIVPELMSQLRPLFQGQSMAVNDHISAEIAKIPMPKETVKVVEKVVEKIVAAPSNVPATGPGSVYKEFQAEASVPVPVLPGVKPAYPEQKPKRPIIALIGPQGVQQADLERDYPNLELLFIEHGKGIKEAARKAEIFIVSHKHNPAQISKQLKANVNKDNIRFVDGGVSQFKRSIDFWLAQKTAA